MSGARHVIAVDPVEFKQEQAQVFGATHSVASMGEATAMVGDLTWGAMADKVILTMGVAQGEYIQPALGMVKKGGRVVQTAVAPFTVDNVSMNLFELTMYEKQLVGSIFGSANPRRDIPRLLRLYQEGQLKLDELVTNTYPIDDINVGYQAMRDGTNIRGGHLRPRRQLTGPAEPQQLRVTACARPRTSPWPCRCSIRSWRARS